MHQPIVLRFSYKCNGYLCYCNFIPGRQIATKFCTCHVMACAKFCSNHLIRIWMNEINLLLNLTCRKWVVKWHIVTERSLFWLTYSQERWSVVSLCCSIEIEWVVFLTGLLSLWALTHWGRVTHICVSKITIIGSDNGLSPGRRQAIIWTNAGILLIGPLGTKSSQIVIEIQTFSFKKMHLKVSSAKWRPFCLGFNVLKLPIFILRNPNNKQPIALWRGWDVYILGFHCLMYFLDLVQECGTWGVICYIVLWLSELYRIGLYFTH